ncbi:MAG: hypothetical protein GEV10_25035 [Streptosporangiales bacterium]|nr:hypothetical protein [Streptosporangiales bacterium]
MPGWARVAAHLIAVCTLPSAVWRLGIIVQFPFGYDAAWIHRSRLDTVFGDVRMILLCIVSELLALLAFGLVQRWGEVVPPWLPPLRGRRIPTWIPTVLAAVGGVGLTAIWTGGVAYAALTGTTFDVGTEPGLPTTVQLVSYAPMVIWGPLLLALTIHYCRRRVSRYRRSVTPA